MGKTVPRHTVAELVTDKQRDRHKALCADDEHAEVEATSGAYQKMTSAYREPDVVDTRQEEEYELMSQLVDAVCCGVPKSLTELITLGGH